MVPSAANPGGHAGVHAEKSLAPEFLLDHVMFSRGARRRTSLVSPEDVTNVSSASSRFSPAKESSCSEYAAARRVLPSPSPSSSPPGGTSRGGVRSRPSAIRARTRSAFPAFPLSALFFLSSTQTPSRLGYHPPSRGSADAAKSSAAGNVTVAPPPSRAASPSRGVAPNERSERSEGSRETRTSSAASWPNSFFSRRTRARHSPTSSIAAPVVSPAAVAATDADSASNAESRSSKRAVSKTAAFRVSSTSTMRYVGERRASFSRNVFAFSASGRVSTGPSPGPGPATARPTNGTGSPGRTLTTVAPSPERTYKGTPSALVMPLYKETRLCTKPRRGLSSRGSGARAASAASSAKARVATARSADAPSTRTVEPRGCASNDPEASPGDPKDVAGDPKDPKPVASYRATTSHGSTTGSQAATRALKCDASATADARASASPLAPARASRETRRIATRAIGTASARTLFDVSSRVRFVRFLDSFTNSVVSTRSTRAAKTVPSRGRPAARGANGARARGARARGADAPGPAASPATAWNAPSASQPFSSPASSSSAKTRSGARGRQMRSGSRPSLNPAPSADQSDATGAAALRFPANFRRPPRANEAEPIAEGGTAHARSARRHATTSMGGGACVSLATWPHATYPSLGTGRQKLSVPLGFPRARQPESRQTRSNAAGGASAGETTVASLSSLRLLSRNRTVLAGGSSPATATSPRETQPGGRRARQTLKSPAAAPALKLCHTRWKSTTVFASTPEPAASTSSGEASRRRSSPVSESRGEVTGGFADAGSPGRPVGTRMSRNASGSGPGRKPSRIVGEKERVLAAFSTTQSAGAPSPTPARPRAPTAAATSSRRTHLSASSGGAPASVCAHTTPKATNPGGGTGRHTASVELREASFFSSVAKKTRSKEIGAAVNAGESRIAVVGAEGGTSAPPSPTTSPSEA